MLVFHDKVVVVFRGMNSIAELCAHAQTAYTADCMDKFILGQTLQIMSSDLNDFASAVTWLKTVFNRYRAAVC